MVGRSGPNGWCGRLAAQWSVVFAVAVGLFALAEAASDQFDEHVLERGLRLGQRHDGGMHPTELGDHAGECRIVGERELDLYGLPVGGRAKVARGRLDRAHHPWHARQRSRAAGQPINLEQED